MNNIFDEAEAIYQAKGQVGVHMWADTLEEPFVYWMHCDPCDCHESPSVADDDGEILCLVCTEPVGEVKADAETY